MSSPAAKYVFFGTPRFAEIVLAGLFAAGMPPAAVVCNPDRPIGRKQIVTPPPTKQLALARDPRIAILQPETLDGAFIEELRALAPDLFVVAAYAKIIPQAVLDIPRRGTIGVHPSLLPKYRGATPIQSAILNGAYETGVTLYRMDEKMDHGPVIVQKKISLDSVRTDYPALEEELAELGAELLVATLPAAAAGSIAPRAQDETQATYTKKFATDDGRVDADIITLAERGNAETAAAIVRKINALTPEPGAWTMRTGKRVKLLKAAIAPDGRLKLLVTQQEGETPREGRG